MTSEVPEIIALTVRTDEATLVILERETVEGWSVKLGPLLIPIAVRVTFPTNPPEPVRLIGVVALDP